MKYSKYHILPTLIDIRKILRYALAAFLVTICATASLQAVMLAQWTFDDSENYLTSSGGTLVPITFSESGVGANQTTTWNSDGTVSLGTGRLLYTSAINSTAMPGLQENVTIWARMRFDEAAASDDTYLGLLDAIAPADWQQFSMVAKRASDGTQNLYSYNTGLGPKTELPAAGSYFDVAMVFETDTETGIVSATLYLKLDGQSEYAIASQQTTSDVSLIPFQSFGLGRLKYSSALGTSFDEVRVYDIALSAAEISAIPESSAAGVFLGMGVLGMAYLVRRRQVS